MCRHSWVHGQLLAKLRLPQCWFLGDISSLWDPSPSPVLTANLILYFRYPTIFFNALVYNYYQNN